MTTFVLRRTAEAVGAVQRTWIRFSVVLVLAAIVILVPRAAMALSVGQRVQATSAVNVRPGPAATTVTGTQAAGALGTLTGGPQTSTFQGVSYVWWYVNWDNSMKGWSIEPALAGATMNRAPTLTSTSTGGATVAVGQAYIMVVNAGDVDGNLTNVDLNWNDGMAVEHRAVSGYGASVIFSRTFSTARTVNWSAMAYDIAGMASTQIRGSFTVTTRNRAPTMTLTSTTGPSVTTAKAYTIVVNTGDLDGNLTNVDVNWDDGTAIERRAVSGYGASVIFSRTFNTTRTINWSAVAYDAAGAASTPIRGSFTVTTTNRAPTLMLTSTSGSSVTTGQAYTIVVSTGDLDGNLTSVDMNWNDGTAVERKVATGYAASVSFSRRFSTAGTINWSAAAYDAMGAASTQLNASLTVTALPAITAWYQPTPLSQPCGVHILDAWLPSVYYGQKLLFDDRLQVGGWGDLYRVYLKFDTIGLPTNVTRASLKLFAVPRGDASTKTGTTFHGVTSAWSPLLLPQETAGACQVADDGTVSVTTNSGMLSWSSQPSATPLTATPAPSGGWFTTDITSTYNDWLAQPWANHGLRIDPIGNANNFDVFRSSRAAQDDQRPALELEFTPPVPMPSFKLPLPGGVWWRPTNEVGGWNCQDNKGDRAHAGNQWASIDWSPENHGSTGDRVFPLTAVPILAAADGIVVRTSVSDPREPNGNYVEIDHDDDGNAQTGFSSIYLHAALPPIVAKGDHVRQGQQIGWMGNTGQDSTGPTSFGTHLHFGLRYNGDGAPGPEISSVVMDGFLLKAFQTECASGAFIRYYRSSNSPARQ